MRTCPSCGFHNMDSRRRCLKCKAVLVHDAKIRTKRKLQLPGTDWFWRVRLWGSRLSRRVRRAFAVRLPEGTSHRFPFTAAFLGLVPGLGQLYNHQPKKALYFLPPFLVFVVLAVRYITVAYVANLLIFAAFSTMMLSYCDALVSAARINGQFFTTRNKLAALSYPFCLFGLLLSGIAVMSYFDFPFLCLYYVNYDYMAPGLRKGDRVAAEGLSYMFADPKPGDVVYYYPPQYSAWSGSDKFIIGPSNAWERVMAVGGETLECADGAFYVDGRELSREFHPLTTRDLPKNFKIECPGNKLLILISSRVTDRGFMARLRGGEAKAPPLGGREWEKACVVERGSFFDRVIYNRAYLVYHPAPHRRILQARGKRFVE